VAVVEAAADSAEVEVSDVRKDYLEDNLA